MCEAFLTRIQIAALELLWRAEVRTWPVSVVEATSSGGARITANDAARFGRDVYALPGSRRNPAAAGCNALLLDGAKPLLDPADILFALGRGGTVAGGWSAPPAPVDADQRAVLRALAGEPAAIDEIERRVAFPAARLGAALRALELGDHVERKRGLWWPR